MSIPVRNLKMGNNQPGVCRDEEAHRAFFCLWYYGARCGRQMTIDIDIDMGVDPDPLKSSEGVSLSFPVTFETGKQAFSLIARASFSLKASQTMPFPRSHTRPARIRPERSFSFHPMVVGLQCQSEGGEHLYRSCLRRSSLGVISNAMDRNAMPPGLLQLMSSG